LKLNYNIEIAFKQSSNPQLNKYGYSVKPNLYAVTDRFQHNLLLYH